jgi:hypothetical protein
MTLLFINDIFGMTFLGLFSAYRPYCPPGENFLRPALIGGLPVYLDI